MMVNAVMRQVVDLGILVFVGYLASIGVSITGGDAMAAIQDPNSVDWQNAGEASVEVGLRFREDDVLIANSDAFAVEMPDYNQQITMMTGR